MLPKIKLLIETHECPNLKEDVIITAKQSTMAGKTWITTFDCNHYLTCPTVRSSENSFNPDPCPLFVTFKSRGNR